MHESKHVYMCCKGVVSGQYFLLFIHMVLLVKSPAMERKLKMVFSLYSIYYIYSAEDVFALFAP